MEAKLSYLKPLQLLDQRLKHPHGRILAIIEPIVQLDDLAIQLRVDFFLRVKQLDFLEAGLVQLKRHVPVPGLLFPNSGPIVPTQNKGTAPFGRSLVKLGVGEDTLAQGVHGGFFTSTLFVKINELAQFFILKMREFVEVLRSRNSFNDF